MRLHYFILKILIKLSRVKKKFFILKSIKMTFKQRIRYQMTLSSNLKTIFDLDIRYEKYEPLRLISTKKMLKFTPQNPIFYSFR